MKNRIQKFLEVENINSSKFADEIGVQRSSISHILSGRNNPSLELIQKILARFDYLNAEWLITGKGDMFKPNRHPSLFDDIYMKADPSVEKIENKEVKNDVDKKITDSKNVVEQKNNTSDFMTNTDLNRLNGNAKIKKIILLYENGKAEVFDA